MIDPALVDALHELATALREDGEARERELLALREIVATLRGPVRAKRKRGPIPPDPGFKSTPEERAIVDAALARAGYWRP